jgi:glucose/arabinose dehydrogenase
MTFRLSTRRALLLAGTLGTLAIAYPATAQQQPAPAAAPAAGAPAPLPPGSPLIGRPSTEGAMKLAPVAPPPIPATAEKLATVPGKLKLQKGFNIELYAGQVPNARSMRQGDKGTVFVGSRLQDKVHYITESGGKRDVKVLVSGLYRPNGLAIKDGTLYIAELSKISKIEKVEDNLDNAKPVMIYDNLPKDEAHGWKFIGIGPDNKLYIPVGQPCNNCLPPDTHAQIRRINLDGSGMEVIAKGVRNTVGFDWHPVSKELYFTDNGRDWASEDVPEDELNRVTKVGEHFGSPFCYQGDFPDPEFGWGRSCSEFTPPVLKTGPHSASLGMRFYTGDKFPAKYKNAIFMARHGSWNRSKKFGGDILAVFLNKDGTVKGTEVFISGFLGPDNNYIGRPVDVLFAKDGSMLISDDYNGAVWRVTYGNQKSAAAK